MATLAVDGEAGGRSGGLLRKMEQLLQGSNASEKSVM
jgi:hypothetical protein